MKKWYSTGWDYMETLKQYPSMKNKRFVGFRKTKRKGFEVISQDCDNGHYWYINECSFDDFNPIEYDRDAWDRFKMKSFVWVDENDKFENIND